MILCELSPNGQQPPPRTSIVSSESFGGGERDPSASGPLIHMSNVVTEDELWRRTCHGKEEIGSDGVERALRRTMARVGTELNGLCVLENANKYKFSRDPKMRTPDLFQE